MPMPKNYMDLSEDWRQRDYESFLNDLAEKASSVPETSVETAAAPAQKKPKLEVAPASAPAPSSAAAPSAGTPSAEDADVADFIKFRKILGDDEAALEATRESSRNRLKSVNLAQAFGDLGAGLAGEKVDPGLYNTMREQEALNVKGAEGDVERNRKLVQNFLTERLQKGALGLKERTLGETIRHDKAAEDIARGKAEKAGEKPSPGQAAIDREYGKEYAKRISEGGYSQAEKGIKQLEDAITNLGKTDSATGPVIGLLPKSARDVITPGGAAIQDQVEEVIQGNLRKALGAQFTEREGLMLLARAYNPRLSEKENIKRLGRLTTQMQQAIKVQKEADDYFAENGTLQGFKGKLFQSSADFDLDDKTEKQKKYAWEK